MADISTELQAIAEAIYGEEVRGSIIDALEAMNDIDEDAEAYAAGTRGGTDVSSDDPAYHNNAKYYAEQAASSASSFSIDDTLTITGQAADAKAAGDRLTNVEQYFYALAAANAVEIPDNTDYNDIGVSGTQSATLNKPGNYVVKSQASAGRMTNCPVSVAHRLFVYSTSSNSRLIQVIFANDTMVPEYRRFNSTGTSSGWSDWRRVAYTVDSPVLDPSLATTLTGSIDYNDLQTPGSYIASSTVAGNASNAPTTSAHRLYVYGMAASGRYLQIVQVNSSDVVEYRRYYNSSTWSSWFQLAYVNNIPVIDSTLSIRGQAADADVTGKQLGAIVNSETYEIIAYTEGGWIDTNPSEGGVDTSSINSSSNYRHAVVPCNPGDMFTITGDTTGKNTHQWLYVFIDENGSPLSHAPTGVKAANMEITAPENAVMLVSDALVASPSYLCKCRVPANRETGLYMHDLINKTSHGHVQYFDIFNTLPMDVYNAEGSVIKSVMGSDYIRIESTAFTDNNRPIINVLSDVSTSPNAAGIDTYNTLEFYLYVYDERKRINFSAVNYTDQTTQEKNRFTAPKFQELFGMQLNTIPAGYYIRVAMISGTDLRLSIWDGAKFGPPLTGYTKTWYYDENTQQLAQRKFSLTGESTVQVPGLYGYVVAKPGYTFIRGYSTNTPKAMNSGFFPTQSIRFDTTNASNLILVKGYNYQTGAYSNEVMTGDLSDYVTIIDTRRTWLAEKPADISQRRVLDKIRKLTTGFKWTPTAQIYDHSNNPYTIGNIYYGVPSRPGDWVTAHFPGWHLTKHTFMNAVADPHSKFYFYREGFYSHVCTSFGELVVGFQYPTTNFGLMRDPNVNWIKTNRPLIGEATTNGTGHCIVPVGLYNCIESNDTAYMLAESADPGSKAKAVYSMVTDNNNCVGSYNEEESSYRIAVYPNYYIDLNTATPYDIEKATVKGTTARPYKGDQCVFTSAEAVKINVYDVNANRLYYQPYSGSVVHGLFTGTPTPEGTAQYISFTPVTSDAPGVYLRSIGLSPQSGEADLQDGVIYGVWVSTNDSQTTPPETVEFFEYRNVHQNQITASVVDGELKTDDEFWYMVGMGYDVIDPFSTANPTHRRGNVSIPYEPLKPVSMDPREESILEEHHDYSKYRELFYLYSNNGDHSGIKAFYRKGKFGAYVVNTDVSVDPGDDDD